VRSKCSAILSKTSAVLPFDAWSTIRIGMDSTLIKIA
jgi:hypothetical protein